jgi:hypothetical protein
VALFNPGYFNVSSHKLPLQFSFFLPRDRKSEFIPQV